MCSKYCLPNYEPVLFDSRREFLAVYHDVLLNLIGKTINGYFLLYDERNNEWNKDAPAILLIDGKQYELTVFQIEYFNMTIDKVDLNVPMNRYADEDREYYIWKKNSLGWINQVLGRRILGINLLDSQFNRISIIDEFPNRRENEDPSLYGIEFMLDKANDSGSYSFLQIYNDTDEIGIEIINAMNS